MSCIGLDFQKFQCQELGTHIQYGVSTEVLSSHPSLRVNNYNLIETLLLPNIGIAKQNSMQVASIGDPKSKIFNISIWDSPD